MRGAFLPLQGPLVAPVHPVRVEPLHHVSARAGPGRSRPGRAPARAAAARPQPAARGSTGSRSTAATTTSACAREIQPAPSAGRSRSGHRQCLGEPHRPATGSLRPPVAAVTKSFVEAQPSTFAASVASIPATTDSSIPSSTDRSRSAPAPSQHHLRRPVLPADVRRGPASCRSPPPAPAPDDPATDRRPRPERPAGRQPDQVHGVGHGSQTSSRHRQFCRR